MKKSFLNVSAVALVIALSLVSCDKTKKAVEEVNENTEAAVNEVAEQGAEELDTIKAQLDTIQAEVSGETPEAK